MAVFLNNQVGFKIGTVDLSDHVKSVTLNRQFDELEVTAMGDTAHRFTKGLESSTLTISFLNDDSSGSCPIQFMSLGMIRCLNRLTMTSTPSALQQISR